jgi:voltage-gated potassium channel
MVAGVGLAGIYTGYVAAWFLRPSESSAEERDTQLAGLASALVSMDAKDLQMLEARLARLQALLRSQA